jgi:hypothetical protein
LFSFANVFTFTNDRRRIVMKGLLVALSVVALSFGASAANAAWMAPPAIYDHAGVEKNSPLPIEDLIDGDGADYLRLYDGVGSGGIGGPDPVTSYLVFDLGQAMEVSGFKYQTTLSAHPDLGPKDTCLFHWTNENTNVQTHGTTPLLLADANIVYTTTQTLPAGSSAGHEWISMDLSSGDKFTARYVGVLFRSGYDTPSNAGIFLDEVQLNTIATPEPHAIVLLSVGFVGLLCYAWRRRK